MWKCHVLDFQALDEIQDTLYKCKTLSNHHLSFSASRGDCIKVDDGELNVPGFGVSNREVGVGGDILMIFICEKKVMWDDCKFWMTAEKSTWLLKMIYYFTVCDRGESYFFSLLGQG